MITDAILDAVFAFLNWVAGALPTWDVGHSGAFQSVVTFCSGTNAYFPLVEVVECMGIILVFEGMVIVWRPLLKFIGVT